MRLFRWILAARQRLYRDRRRYAICAVLLFAAGAITFWDYAARPYGIPFPLLSGMAFLIGIGIFMPVISLVVPSFRFAMEIGALTLFLFALAGRVWPAADLLLGVSGPSNLLYLFGFLVVAHIIHWLVYGTWSDRWLTTDTHPLKGIATSRLSSPRLWDGFILSPGKEDLYHSDDVVEVTDLPDHPHAIRVVSETSPGALLEEHQYFDRFAPPYDAAFRWVAVNAKSAPGTQGTATLKIEDRGKRRVITRTLNAAQQPLRVVWRTWIDDGLGRNMDMQIAALTHAARTPD